MTSAINGEREWHNRLYSDQAAAITIPDAVFKRYVHPTNKALFKLERLFEILGDINGKHVLVYGCGDGALPVLFAAKGAIVCGIDISDVAISRQRERAEHSVFGRSLNFSVGTVEDLPYRSNCFDIVVGTYILHHLPDALCVARDELRRVLKTDGWAVFIEPVLRSRLMPILRKLFPDSDVSPRERQLTDADFALFSSLFALKEENFDFLGSLNRYIVADENSSQLRWKIARSIAQVDAMLFKAGFRHLARYSMVTMHPIISNPTKL